MTDMKPLDLFAIIFAGSNLERVPRSANLVPCMLPME